jgi:hypothetical protein
VKLSLSTASTWALLVRVACSPVFRLIVPLSNRHQRGQGGGVGRLVGCGRQERKCSSYITSLQGLWQSAQRLSLRMSDLYVPSGLLCAVSVVQASLSVVHR